MCSKSALTLALLEVRTAWRRPSLWVFLAILFLMTWGLSSGSLTIGAGSRVAGGERAFLNSEFNLAFGDILVFTLFYVFFACTAFGNAPSEDDGLRQLKTMPNSGIPRVTARLQDSFSRNSWVKSKTGCGSL